MTELRPGGLELTLRGAALAELKTGDAVLDVGCGQGASLEYLERELGIVPCGVDISQNAVQRAGKNCISLADACALPFPDGCFDAVLMECVITLLPRPEAALLEAARVLRAGGRLILTTLSVESGAGLLDEGRLNMSALGPTLRQAGLILLHNEDRSGCLRDFIAGAIFRFGSLEAYLDYAQRELGGSVLSCRVPPKGTGYRLIIAQKPGRGVEAENISQKNTVCR